MAAFAQGAVASPPTSLATASACGAWSPRRSTRRRSSPTAPDPLAGPAHARWWQERLPNARLGVAHDAGHLVVISMWTRAFTLNARAGGHGVPRPARRLRRVSRRVAPTRTTGRRRRRYAPGHLAVQTMKRHPALVPLASTTITRSWKRCRLRRASDAAENERRKAVAAFLRFYSMETLRHFREEEERLFPALVGQDGAADDGFVQRCRSTSGSTRSGASEQDMMAGAATGLRCGRGAARGSRSARRTPALS